MAPDLLWSQAVLQATSKLPSKDIRWLSESKNQEPFTSAELLEKLQPVLAGASKGLLNRFFFKIDSILSHITSFTAALGTLSQADPTGAGLVWGSLLLLITVACRTRQTLNNILEVLYRLSPELDLFSRWRRLFPDKNFKELATSIQLVYVELVRFCVAAVKHMKRNYLSKLLHTAFCPVIEQEFQLRQAKILYYMKRVREEVETANMETVQKELSEIKNYVKVPLRSPVLNSPLPMIRLVPHSRNFRFFGRDCVLRNMHQVLQQYAKSGQHLFTLFGLGGSGKTQIAIEYTYRHLEDYQAVMWILSDNADKIQQGFRDIAELMGLERTAKNATQAKSFVLHRLASCGERYLLVFDNVDDTNLVKGCFPISKNGSILITTRDAASAGTLSQYSARVPEFSVEEGAWFLDSLISEGRTGSKMDSNRRSILNRISSIFHGYPLGLSQVAGFIRSGGSSLENFEALMQDQKSSSGISSLPVDDYHHTLLKTWELLLGSLGRDSRLILDILVYLDSDSIPYDLFREGCKEREAGKVKDEIQFMADPLAFWKALRGLQRQSLIRINPDLQTMSIHRFSQERARAQLSQDITRRKAVFELTLHILSNSHPEFLNYSKHWAPAIWKSSEKFLPHVKTLQNAFLADPQAFKGLEVHLARVMYHCATYEFESNHYTEAAESFKTIRKVLDIAESPDILLLCDCYRVEGRLFNEMNVPEQARHRNTKARQLAELCIDQGLFKSHDSRMSRILSGLGNTMSQLGDLDKALALQHEAMRLCRKVPNEQSDASIIVQSNLGFLLLRRRDINGAERLLQAIVDEKPEAAYAWYPLGNTYLQQGRVEEGLAAHLTALRIYTSWFGEYHTFVADSMYKTGEILLLHKDDAQQASEYLRRAYHVYTSQSSCSDLRRHLARCARTLAKSLEKLGQNDEAMKFFDQAWQLREQTEGKKGSPLDDDNDYVDVLFYWSH